MHSYQMTTPYTTEDVLEMVTADDDDDVVEHFDLQSDDELEFNNYDEQGSKICNIKYIYLVLGQSATQMMMSKQTMTGKISGVQRGGRWGRAPPPARV